MLCTRPSALPRHGRRTKRRTRTSSARHARRRRSVSGRRFVNVRHCRPRSANRQEIGVVGIRKLAQTAQESSSEGSYSCPIRRVGAAHPGNLSGFNQLAATLRCCGRRNWTSRHGEDAMAANTQAKTDRARCGRRGGVYFSAAPLPVAEMLPGRLRVLRIPEAPRACSAKIRPERVGSACIFQLLCSQSQKCCRADCAA